ncbi:MULTISPECIES: response regulator [Bacillaceae]|uniref:response regulator transcription factor n=1 Tax=Bacillaceae TaxID=186817 RepID=UPI000AFAC828|nr:MULTISPECIES: response regulator [Bacillaceae]MCM3361085.1 response regulator [Niallia sp. MER TA 168]
MLKVLIVDDEPYIREGIKVMIDWGNYGFEICYEAGNGEDALQIILDHELDIVLTDIKMPVMSGLELIKQVKKSVDKEIRFVILSGFYEFEYAKKAIQYKVTDYLLKPIQEKELIDLLETINKGFMLLKRKEKEEEKKNKAIVDYHMKNILYDKFTSKDIEFIKGRHGEFKNYTFINMDVVPENKQERVTVEQKKKWRDRLYSVLENMVQEENFLILYDIENTNMEFSVSVIWQCLRSEVYRTNYLAKLQKKLMSEVPFKVKIYIGSTVENIEDINASYNNVVLGKEYEYFYCADKEIIDCKKLPTFSLEQYHLSQKWINQYINSITENNEQRIKSVIEQIYDKFHQKCLHPQLIKNNLTLLIYQLSDLWNKNSNKHFSDDEYSLFIHDQKNLLSGKISMDEFLTYSLTFAHYLYSIKNSSSKDILVKIEQDIEECYMEKLSLRKLGDKYNINSVYLGQLFSKKYGIAFKDYLNEYRIEKACQLLEQTDDRIYQIATNIGFQNPDYFIKKFLQVKKVTPRKYRLQGRKVKEA